MYAIRSYYVYSYYDCSSNKLATTITDLKAALVSFSGSSADLSNLYCLSSAPVVPISRVADDFPVVLLPAVVFMS